MTPERVIRLAIDVNVLFAELRAAQRRLTRTACAALVDFIREGRCPAGPVQFVTSVATIETWANVLRRKLNFPEAEADRLAWLLQDYASEGPLSLHPQIVVGSGHIAFGTEAEMRQAVVSHARPENAAKLFDELTDDRHVLLSALAARADLLATADLDDFRRGPAVSFVRDDVLLYPLSGYSLVIGKPAFVAYWLNRGVVPDHQFVTSNPGDFRLA